MASKLTLEMISECLWALRARVEAELASLTDAQKIVEDLRTRAGDAPCLFRQRLAVDLESMLRTHHHVRDAMEDCTNLIRELDPEP